MGAGSMFTSMVVAGFVVGYILDALFDTLPVFLMLCGVLGFVGGLLKVNKLLGKMDLLDPQKPAKAVDRNETPSVTKEEIKSRNDE
jgi:ATP synthase protein I